MDDHVAPQCLLIRVTGISSAAIGLSFRTPLLRFCGREIDARDLDDGLPRGFLAGAIVEVGVALASIGPVNFP